MKKLFQSTKFKRYNSKKIRRSLKRLHNREQKPPKTQPQKKPVTIKAPTNFSITENTKNTLDFFKECDEKIRDCPIFLDINKVKKLTGDSLLYILSRLQHYTRSIPDHMAAGNEPRDQDCRKLFIESGFYRYVDAHQKTDPTHNSDIFSIEYGDDAKTNIAQDAEKFVEKCGIPNTDGKIYTTLIECMANTKNHAYEEEGGKWWLMAQKVPEGVRFIFLDNGVGIPKTVIKKSKCQQLEPERCIEGALQGSLEIDPKHQREGRGKGLPKIYEFATEGLIHELGIISGRGRFDCAKGASSLPNGSTFHGTMLFWSVLKNGNR